MSRNGSRYGGLCVLAAILLPLAVIGARGGDFDRVIFAVDPASDIRIQIIAEMEQSGQKYECLQFTNASSKAATRIRFVFNYFDAKAHALGFDVFDHRKTVPAGPTGVWNYDGCTAVSPPAGIVVNVVTVERVEYDDGTSWALAGTNADSPTAIPKATATP